MKITPLVFTRRCGIVCDKLVIVEFTHNECARLETPQQVFSAFRSAIDAWSAGCEEGRKTVRAAGGFLNLETLLECKPVYLRPFLEVEGLVSWEVVSALTDVREYGYDRELTF